MGGATSSCCQSAAECGQQCVATAPLEAHKLSTAGLQVDDPDALSDLPTTTTVDHGPKRRRGIVGERLLTTAVKEYRKPVYPKDASVVTQIHTILTTDPKMQVLFGHLGEQTIHDIVNAFKERLARRGDILIRQGAEGDSLYLIEIGEVSIFVARPSPAGELRAGELGSEVAKLGPGKLFGELALLYSAPRAASAIVAAEQCRLWQLDREPFKMLLVQRNQAIAELYQGWLSAVDILKVLNQYELTRLRDLLESEIYDEGEVIIRQGEPGDKFYILEDGNCSAFILGLNGEQEVNKYSRQGEYFGEIALLTDEPRRATIRATGTGASVLSISRDDFTSVLGPIEDILRKHIDQYPNYKDFLREG